MNRSTDPTESSEGFMTLRFVVAALLLLVAPTFALDGDPSLHDPSTVIQADGRFYAYATGGGLPFSVSDDGWAWRRGGSAMASVAGGRSGPDVIARGGNNTPGLRTSSAAARMTMASSQPRRITVTYTSSYSTTG